eukprot:gene4002-4356_t
MDHGAEGANGVLGKRREKGDGNSAKHQREAPGAGDVDSVGVILIPCRLRRPVSASKSSLEALFGILPPRPVVSPVVTSTRSLETRVD